MSVVGERHGIWLLRGNAHQNDLIRQALDACDFPFEQLAPEVQRQQGRDHIVVEWADLSRFSEDPSAESSAHDHGDHVHEETLHSHVHVHEGDDKAHGIGYRSQVLGLAWYSLKVSIDDSLTFEPELAQEVFLSEAAHMIDFAFMSGLQRVAVYNAFHDVHEDLPAAVKDLEDGVEYGHGHGWFDVGGYYSWVGEAFMGGFIKAYAPTVPVTIPFDHPATEAVGAEIRSVLTPEPTPPEPAPKQPGSYFITSRGQVFHDSHKGCARYIEYATYDEAVADGFRPCRVCKPSP